MQTKQHYTSLSISLCKLRLNKNSNWEEEVDVTGAMEGRRRSRRRVSRREAQSHKAEEFLKLSHWCTCLARRKTSPNATTMMITMMIPLSRLTPSFATAFNVTTRSLFSWFSFLFLGFFFLLTQLREFLISCFKVFFFGYPIISFLISCFKFCFFSYPILSFLITCFKLCFFGYPVEKLLDYLV